MGVQRHQFGREGTRGTQLVGEGVVLALGGIEHTISFLAHGGGVELADRGTVEQSIDVAH